jgi:simple sugar transport system permease protein
MIYFRADQVVTGIAFNIAMLGATSFLYAVIETRQGALTAARAEPFNVPLLSDLPGVGVLFSQHWFVPFGPLLVVAVWYLVYRTGVGLRLRACGDFAAGAHASGVNVGAYRFWAVVASGALAGLAGAFLSLVVVQSFTENMTAGRGYIALTIVILGRWRPVGVALGAVLFAFAEGVSVVWQGRWGLPSQFFLSVPYLLTLLAVAASARASTAPREEGRPLTVRS